MKRLKRLTRHEEIIRAIDVASRAIDRVYRHPAATVADKRAILGVLFALHIDGGAGLQLERREVK